MKSLLQNQTHSTAIIQWQPRWAASEMGWVIQRTIAAILRSTIPCPFQRIKICQSFKSRCDIWKVSDILFYWFFLLSTSCTVRFLSAWSALSLNAYTPIVAYHVQAWQLGDLGQGNISNLGEVVNEAVKNWYMQHSVDGVNWLLEINGIFIVFPNTKFAIPWYPSMSLTRSLSGATILDHSTSYCPGMICMSFVCRNR